MIEGQPVQITRARALETSSANARPGELLAIDKAGHEALCIAPNKDQMHTINHLTNEPTQEKRNTLIEAARIARGQIQDIQNVSEDAIDALIFPGGFGAAKNLCNFATDGDKCVADPDVEKLLKAVHAQKKPIGAICIAPALIARVIGEGVELTIGNDAPTAQALESMGAKHEDCPVTEFKVDEQNNIVSTPAYMLAQSIHEAAQGIEKLVNKVIELAQAKQTAQK